jgi:hypothetical protein
VAPSGKSKSFHDLPWIVSETEAWLSALDPDDIDPTDLPARHFADEAGEVEITAIPKKPSARTLRAQEIVGNPFPILSGWTSFDGRGGPWFSGSRGAYLRDSLVVGRTSHGEGVRHNSADTS